MSGKRLRTGILLVIICLMAGLLSACGQPAAQELNGEQIMADDMLNSVMDYIKQNHPDSAPFIKESILGLRVARLLGLATRDTGTMQHRRNHVSWHN